MWFFYYFYYERNYDDLELKSPCFLLNKSINFNKNETEPCASNKNKNRKSWIKSKTVMSWSSGKKREWLFCGVYFVLRNFF